MFNQSRSTLPGIIVIYSNIECPRKKGKEAHQLHHKVTNILFDFDESSLLNKLLGFLRSVIPKSSDCICYAASLRSKCTCK